MALGMARFRRRPHHHMHDRPMLVGLRTHSMACWLEGLEQLGRSHRRANDHAP